MLKSTVGGPSFVPSGSLVAASAASPVSQSAASSQGGRSGVPQLRRAVTRDSLQGPSSVGKPGPARPSPCNESVCGSEPQEPPSGDADDRAVVEPEDEQTSLKKFALNEETEPYIDAKWMTCLSLEIGRC